MVRGLTGDLGEEEREAAVGSDDERELRFVRVDLADQFQATLVECLDLLVDDRNLVSCIHRATTSLLCVIFPYPDRRDNSVSDT